MCYTTQVIRDRFTSLQTIDWIDPNCDQASTFLFNDPLKLLFLLVESCFQATKYSLRQYSRPPSGRVG
ncbi:MAG: hypothetical protein AMR96_04245 [Candidatus Adiutrix intracellularis]|nr:MAG: hypothetical protein AMR96_04245 [Candidatus Adiutrix intracellularis]